MKRINYDKVELRKILKNFYEMTGMLLSFYDTSEKSILAYPGKDCAFCTYIRSVPERLARCRASDGESFRRCRELGECIIYQCHVGLVEVTAPIMIDGYLVGYLMVGQMSNMENREELRKRLEKMVSHEDLSEEQFSDLVDSIVLHSDEQILAATKILEICISYLQYRNIISMERENFDQQIREYLLEHLSEDLSVDQICQRFSLSRRKLYEYFQMFFHCSVAKYIKKIRIEAAGQMLKDTNLGVAAIAEKCGFTDYNYFSRVFKAEMGVSAREFRLDLAPGERYKVET